MTKRERVLTLLSRSEGASIEEMMQAIGWRQHSVRGFLAGTVKKKLGFSLTSLKGDDGSAATASKLGAVADMNNAAVDVAGTLARLSEMTLFELRVEWRRLHRAPPPMRLSRDLLTRAIAYRLQEHAYGGLSKSTLRKLQRLNLDSASCAPKHAPPISLKAGARLVREWRGVTHACWSMPTGSNGTAGVISP